MLVQSQHYPRVQIPSLEDIQAEIRRRSIIDDPVLWAKEKLDTHLWSKQREILRAITKFPRVSVRSCHASGKSRLAATAVLYWLNKYPGKKSFVITTASRGAQVKAVLWREIGHLFHMSGIRGKCLTTEIKCNWDGKDHLVAFGRKPADLDDTAFQGLHAEHVLIVIDEASGVPKLIWDAAESIVSGGDGAILAIGNPTKAGTDFHKTFRKKSGYHNFHISAAMTPNFTDEEVPAIVRKVLVQKDWVKRMKVKWGVDSPVYGARVDGNFPESNEFGFYSDASIEIAQEANLDPDHRLPIIGVDVGKGGDPTVFGLRLGPWFRIIEVSYDPDTRKIGKRIVQLIDKYTEKYGVKAHAVIDSVGVGEKAFQIANLHRPSQAHPCDFGGKAHDIENYHNRKAELYDAVRERLTEGTLDIDPDDEDLYDEMTVIDALTDVAGRIKVKDKDQVRRELGRSTDRLDTLTLTFGKEDTYGMPISIGSRSDVKYN